MSSDIMDKWKRLLEGDANGNLHAELEGWARNAPSGEALDWVCAQWMGDERKFNDPHRAIEWWTAYSTDPAAAMELLEAMPHFGVMPGEDQHVWSCGQWHGDLLSFGDVEAGNPRLAIARACAVIAAWGIERGQG